jgi:cystathionine beta-lyase/cystathionine gamma-synthase
MNGNSETVRQRSTCAVRAGVARDTHHGAVIPPIHLSSTFSFEKFGTKRQFDYTRSGNPTREYLACALAELEGGVAGVVTSSGMSAVALALQLVRPGDLVLAAHLRQQTTEHDNVAAKRGERPESSLKGASREMFNSMSEKQLDEFASTKRKNLPEHTDSKE